MSAKHLWEYNHPYYASEGNYFSNDCCAAYESWKDFYEGSPEEKATAKADKARGIPLFSPLGAKNEDDDYNLVYRWDWKIGEDHGLEPNEHRLFLYYIGQRKALARSVEIKVTPADEEAGRAFQRGRAFERKAVQQANPKVPPKGELYVVRDDTGIAEAA